MDNKPAKQFSWRSFISFGLLLCFIVIFISGIILYLAPPGRVSFWTDWRMLGLLKTQWQALHTIFSYLFAILAIFHLFSINWRTFLAYIRKKTSKGLNHKRELLWALALFAIILPGTALNWPPFSYVVDFGEYLTDRWDTNENAAPVPHAEELNLEEIALLLNKPIDDILQKLDEKEIDVNHPGESLETIGQRNKKSPQEIYDHIAPRSHQGKDKIHEPHRLGRKTVRELAGHLGKSTDELIDALKAEGIDAHPDDQFRHIARQAGKRPRDLLESIR